MKFSQRINYYYHLIKGKLDPFTFSASKYASTFLVHEHPSNNNISNTIPQVIYCFWTGTNPLPENRKKALEALEKTTNVRVVLVHPGNLNTYLVDGQPLHAAYQHLSLVHKSDYLRTYFMHHHGGGYSDIKKPRHSWKAAFDHMQKDTSCYILGYRELGAYAVAQLDGNLGNDLKENFSIILGNCAYMARAYSPFTTDWITELHRRLDAYAPDLARYPGNTMGDNEGYPIPWTGILGDIFHPLCLKYSQHLSYASSIKPSFKNYR